MPYTNSALSDYIYLLPEANNRGVRKEKIRNIIIRDNKEFCGVSNVGATPESIINSHVKKLKSAHYAVGNDGRIGLAVKETVMANSSTKANDEISITIIVAENMNKVAQKSLIKLLSDVCRRNGISRLVLKDKHKDNITLMLPKAMDKAVKKVITSTVINSANSSIGNSYSGDFVPRLNIEGTDASGESYWGNMKDSTSKAYQYYYGSKCFDPIGSWDGGYGLPNCTAYAWGRFREVAEKYTGKLPTKVIPGNAGDWYDNAKALGYEVSETTPKLGAIICWWHASAGHVAIVEEISSNGKEITLSESGYQGDDFRRGSATKLSDGTWYSSYVGGYDFKGFIYVPSFNPGSFSENTGGYTDRQWVAKENTWYEGGLTDEEKENNAILLARFFSAKGWTFQAIAGMLGNVAGEGLFNPGQWEYETELYGTFPNELPAIDKDFDGRYDSDGSVLMEAGYGFVGWTPYTNYAHWVLKHLGKDVQWRRNGEAQCARIQYELENNLQYSYVSGEHDRIKGLETFKGFSRSTGDPYWLARCFMLCYERPADQSNTAQHYRGKKAEQWYQFLLNNSDEIRGISGPGITLVEQNSYTLITLSGYAGGNKEKTKSVHLYYKWDGRTLDPKNKNTYDGVIKLTIGKPYTRKLKKPRLAKTIAIVILQDNKKDEKDKKKDTSQRDSVYVKLTPSYPCMHVQTSNNKLEPFIPYLYTGTKYDLYVPVIKLEDGWYAIYNTGIEKVAE